MNERDILSIRQNAIQNKFNSIHSDVTYIGDKLYQFADVEMVPGILSVKMPSKFMPLPPNIAKQKYPSESRPKYIYASANYEITFAFNMYRSPDPVRGAMMVANEFLRELKKFQPHAKFNELTSYHTDENPSRVVSWVDYTTDVYDGVLYNLQGFAVVGELVAHLVFNCGEENSKAWKPKILEMLETMRLPMPEIKE